MTDLTPEVAAELPALCGDCNRPWSGRPCGPRHELVYRLRLPVARSMHGPGGDHYTIEHVVSHPTPDSPAGDRILRSIANDETGYTIDPTPGEWVIEGETAFADAYDPSERWDSPERLRRELDRYVSDPNVDLPADAYVPAPPPWAIAGDPTVHPNLFSMYGTELRGPALELQEALNDFHRTHPHIFNKQWIDDGRAVGEDQVTAPEFVLAIVAALAWPAALVIVGRVLGGAIKDALDRAERED